MNEQTYPWYMVNKDGMCTLCADQADAEREAKDAQDAWPHMGPHRAVRLVEVGDAGFTAADMATAAAQGFRDGQAANSVLEDAARLDWLLWKLPGDSLRYVVGDLSDTSDAAEFRTAIDAARKQGANHD